MIILLILEIFSLDYSTCSQYCISKAGTLSLIVRVNIVLNRTVVVDSDWRFNNLCPGHLQSQSELYHVSWLYYTLVIYLIGELRCNVIGCLSSVSSAPVDIPPPQKKSGGGCLYTGYCQLSCDVIGYEDS